MPSLLLFSTSPPRLDDAELRALLSVARAACVRGHQARLCLLVRHDAPGRDGWLEALAARAQERQPQADSWRFTVDGVELLVWSRRWPQTLDPLQLHDGLPRWAADALGRALDDRPPDALVMSTREARLLHGVVRAPLHPRTLALAVGGDQRLPRLGDGEALRLAVDTPVRDPGARRGPLALPGWLGDGGGGDDAAFAALARWVDLGAGAVGAWRDQRRRRRPGPAATLRFQLGGEG